MSPTSPDRIVLTGQQRHELNQLTHAGRTQQRVAQRTAIVLRAADGHSNAAIAAAMGICPDTVRKWRHRWCTAPGVGFDEPQRVRYCRLMSPFNCRGQSWVGQRPQCGDRLDRGEGEVEPGDRRRLLPRKPAMCPANSR